MQFILTCNRLAMDAERMLNGCSMVAETILSILSLISYTDDYPPADKKTSPYEIECKDTKKIDISKFSASKK